jgi:hypothetical protein
VLECIAGRKVQPICVPEPISSVACRLRIVALILLPHWTGISTIKLNFIILQVGADNNLLVKEHTHTFVNKGFMIVGMFSYHILIIFVCVEQYSYAVIFLIAFGIVLCL